LQNTQNGEVKQVSANFGNNGYVTFQVEGIDYRIVPFQDRNIIALFDKRTRISGLKQQGSYLQGDTGFMLGNKQRFSIKIDKENQQVGLVNFEPVIRISRNKGL